MTTTPTQSKAEQAIADRVIQSFNEMQLHRANFNTHWDEIARYLWPNMWNTFWPAASRRTPGQKDTQLQIDSTPQIALGQFGAILDSLLTPKNQTWHGLMAEDDELAKDRETKLWMEKSTRVLFKLRYAETANYSSQNSTDYMMLGAFGTSCMFIDKLMSSTARGVRGVRYKSCPIGEIFVRENHQGIVDTVYRVFRLKPRQAAQAFGPDRLQPEVQAAAQEGKDRDDWYIHCVEPNDEYDDSRLDYRGKTFVSYYVSIGSKMLLATGGYHTMPYIVSRYEQAPGEVYGRSPAMQALPSIKTLQEMKKAILKQAHRTVDPVLLLADDGILDAVAMRPGAQNYGGLSSAGNELVKTLPVGNTQIGLDMMDQERATINAPFLVHLFQILTETPAMTATEVIERTREKSILLAPTVGRQQSEKLGPQIERELDLAAQLGLLPPMPVKLRQAFGRYQVTYNSPLSRAMRAEEASGFVRTVEVILPIVQTTGDPSPLDRFDMDRITVEVADINGMPVSWTRSDEALAALRAQRAKAAAAEQATKEAPGKAALLNAAGKAKSNGLENRDAAAIISGLPQNNGG